MNTTNVPGTPALHPATAKGAVKGTAIDAIEGALTGLDQAFTPAPEADDPSRGREVFAPTEGAFEAPAKEFVPGPYYMAIDEIMPQVSERPAQEATAAFAGAPAPKSGFNVDRRDFMKLFSVSSMAAASACVRRPLEKVVPYVNQPVDQFPGEPVYYATTCGECAAGCGVMVKTREGRPVKIEGLPAHPVNNGRMCAVGQSTLQGLYHPQRQKQPMIKFGSRYDKVTWDDVYAHLGARLSKLSKVGILTSASTGHRHAFYKEFLEKIGSNANRLYTYDSNSLAESVAAAHQTAFGVHALPRADLQKAKLIVGIGADFLDIGYSLLFHMRSYTEGHGYANGTKSRHVQFESGLTQTGGRSDERFAIPPGSETLVTLLLVRSLFELKNSKASSAARAQISQVLSQKADLLAGGYERVGIKREAFDKLAEELLAESSVVMCGGSYSFDENATNLQLAAIMANELIGAYDNVLHLQKGWMVPGVQAGDLPRFLNEAADLEALIVIDVDPSFSLPPSWGVSDLLKKIPTLVSMQSYPAELDKHAHYVLNTNHYLESWGDEQPVAGFWSMRQPVVRTTTDSRQAEEVLMWLAATMKKPLGYEDYRAFLRKKWAAVHQVAGAGMDFDSFFDVSVQKGFVDRIATQAVGEVSGNLASNFKYVDVASSGLRLVAPLDYRLHDGKFAHRPILQETQDAMTTITWDTWVAMNPGTMQKLGFRQFDVVKLEGPAGGFEASLYPLPGLHPDAVVVPRGNGHAKDMGLVEGGNGINPLVALARASDGATGAPVTAGQAVKLTRTGAIFQMAAVQKHNDIANRHDIVRKVGLASAHANQGKTKDLDTVPDLYPKIPNQDFKWGMAIDLARCTGCGACQVACSTENNVPQVGREQILLGREMYWIRLDRYFAGSSDQPTVTFQPMLCQHCNHAPCEAVCPVYATTHDPEGVNQMTYNRCIGTRYCANACPYKIRRFNWWTHKWGVIGERLQDRNPRAMNPDVTVRTRGVMEKCQFCYQRVRDAKHRVKMRKTPLVDGELQVACQQTCPTDAIVFGNLLDPNAKISGARKDYRAYLALGGEPEHGHYGIKTLPSVNYMMDVTLSEQSDGHSAPGEHGAPKHHG